MTHLNTRKRWLITCLMVCLSLYTCLLQASDSDPHSPTVKKVALLFLTCGDLNHSEFWKEYLAPHLDKFNLYIHPKNPVQDPFFAPFTIRHLARTSWDRTIYAEKKLIEEAFSNPDNYKFVLLSQSCVPLVDAETVYNVLVKDNLSYFYWTGGGWWDPNNPREVKELPKHHRKGNNQWFTLNRRHAEVCVRDDFIIRIIAKHPIDNESYPSSLFSVYHCLDEVVNFGYTFVDWSRPSGGGAHPYTFTTLNEGDTQVLADARTRGYLFARKFAPEYPSSALKAFIESNK